MKNKKNNLKLKPYEKFELELLKSEEDKYGKNISQMSDFLNLCVKHQMTIFSGNRLEDVFNNFPISDIGIIGEVILGAKSLFNKGVSYIPDFDRLPKDIRMKLEKGIYSIGESKQVEGNMRAVILDENGVRIKDITLKKAGNSFNNIDSMRNLTNQIQLKNIKEMIDSVQQLQNYQLDRDRDRDLLVPFLNARDKILMAQNAKIIEDRKLYLDKAIEQMGQALNGVRTDLETTKKQLAEFTRHPFTHRKKTFEKMVAYLSSDIELLTKFTGVQMFIYNYLGLSDDAQNCLDNYNYTMKMFITEKVGKSSLTGIELLQDNTVYNSENMDYWFKFSNKMLPFLDKDISKIESVKDIYIVSLEEPKDEK